MAPIEFKFSRVFESTRRVSFPEPPSWLTLASKIGFLYDIPTERVGVSYVDSDDDEITISSEDELRDYLAHATVTVPGATLKLTVHDLGNRQKSLPATPRTSRNTFGMPLGTGAATGLFTFADPAEDEWHSIPALAGLDGVFGLGGLDVDEGPHAFVEVVSSDASAVGGAEGDKGKGRDSGERPEPSVVGSNYRTAVEPAPAAFAALKGKAPDRPESVASRASSVTPAPTSGKGKKSSTDVDTAASVIANETPVKPPVHVQPARPTAREGPKPAPIPPSREDATPTGNQGRDPHAPSTESQQSPSTATGTPGDAPSVSLYNDIASLITTAASIFAQHPELSDGLRNLIAHASSGAYLGNAREAAARSIEEVQRAAEREARRVQQDIQGEAQRVAADVRRAAAEVQQAANADRRAAEHDRMAEVEARSRVAEALGGLFSAFAGTPPAQPTAPEANAAAAVPVTVDVPPPVTTAPEVNNNVPRNRFTWHITPSGAPDVLVPSSFTPILPVAPIPPVPPVAPAVAPIPPAVPVPPTPLVAPVPPIALTPRAPPTPFPGPVPPLVPSVPPAATATTATAVPPVSTAPTSPIAPALPRLPLRSPHSLSPGINRSNSRRVASDPQPSARSPQRELSPKERLEEAKRLYKTEKDAYRRDRAERLRRGENISAEKSGSDGERPSKTADPKVSSPPHTPLAGASGLPGTAPVTSTPRRPKNLASNSKGQDREELVVSSARNGVPRLELVSVPGPQRRSSKMDRRQSRGSLAAHVLTDPEASTPSQRIRRRLADMGFPHTVYTGLPDLIEIQLANNKEPSRSEEDEIVTRLLEEMLSYSPPKSQGSTI